MTALIVIICILAVLILIAQFRVGAAVSFSEDGLFLRLKLGPVKLQILPAKPRKKPKKEKPKQEKPAKKTSEEEDEATEEKPKRKLTDTIGLARQFLPLLADAAGRFKRKIRIDELTLHVIWGASDPAAAAKGYGMAHAVLGILWPPLERSFNIKEHDLRVFVDFDRTKPAVTAAAQATLTIGQSLALALRLGLKALCIYIGYSRNNKRQTAKTERKQNKEQNMKDKAVQA